MLIGLQNLILRMVAQGDGLEDTLIRLCTEVERLLPGTFTSILMLDSNGFLQPKAAPSLPMEYSLALENLPVGPDIGSCGSAAFLARAVSVSDIEHDPRWVNYKALALPRGLKACFSSPIFGSRGNVLGTFALYFREPREPTPLEQSVVEGCVPLCMIALERHERVVEHRRLAFTDVLTGLPNRAKFNAVIENEMAGKWSLLLIAVDNLKTVNDTFGHATGDELIATVAARLASIAQPQIVYRLGGDEFAIILASSVEKYIEMLSRQIITTVNQPAICDGHTVFPSVTVGAAIRHSDNVPIGVVRHNADLALYHAKELNRGDFKLHD